MQPLFVVAKKSFIHPLLDHIPLLSLRGIPIVEVRFLTERDIPSLGVRTGGWVEVDVSAAAVAVAAVVVVVALGL